MLHKDHSIKAEQSVQLAPINMVEFQCPKCDYVYWRSQLLSKAEMKSRCPVCQIEFIQVHKRLDQAVINRIDQIFAEQIRRGFKKGWVGYQVLKIPNLGFFELLEVAKRLNYLPWWAYKKYFELLELKGGVA